MADDDPGTAPAGYRSIARAAEHEIVVRRSRFRCRLTRVETRADVRAAVDARRREHPNARHHCWAFQLGPTGADRGSSDDGEPSGTAGAPMLDVLAGAQLSDVLAVVTRYFGGVLLGAGGLVRAYAQAVRDTLAQAGTVRRVSMRRLQVRVGHADAGRLEHELRHRHLVTDVDYGTQVTLHVLVRAEDSGEVTRWVAGSTGGQADVVADGCVYVDEC